MIFAFGLTYWMLPNSSFSQNIDFIKGQYFSVVTITTLGYGEITPTSNTGRILTSLESLFGILIFGVFINSIWRSFGIRIEESQQKKIDGSLKQINRLNLESYCSYLKVVLYEYEKIVSELVTPIEFRNDVKSYNSDFNFIDLRDLYKSSLSLKYSLDVPIVSIYYDKEHEVFDEFKFLLSNFNLGEFVELKKLVLDYLTLSKQHNFESIILFFNKSGNTGEYMEYRKLMEDLIVKHAEHPSIEEGAPNTLYPFIMLFHSLKDKMNILEKIKLEINAV